MNTILLNLFRLISLFLISYNLFYKQLKFPNKSLRFFVSTIIYFISCIVFQYLFSPISAFISLLLFCIFIKININIKWKLSLFISSITYSIFYCTNYICCLLITVIYIPFYYNHFTPSKSVHIILTGILPFILLYYIFKLKLIKIPKDLLANKTAVNIVLIVCGLILFIKYIDYLDNPHVFLTALLPTAAILLAILLFTWWRRQITKSYIEKLRKLEIQSLYDELTEKEEQIKKLTGDNEALSRIIHKDNKLIPAMEHLVSEFLSDNDFNNPEDLKQYGSNLTKQLHDMTRDRRGILENYEHGNHKLKLTGHVALDAILVYMQKKAKDQNILFECKHNEDSLNYLLSKISEEDLSHLLSDFLENAIISMRETGNGRLQVTFGKLQKEAYIAIADTGSDFELSTLHSFGISPNTTHGNDGGSGIGLMDIWKLKRKYRATIQIQEYEKNSNTFTKRILFSFNSKNHYVIQSYRHTEISNNQTRGDLYVIPMDTVRKNEDKEYERNDQNLNS